MRAAGRDPDPPPGLSTPYALRTLIDELTVPPVVVRDGVATEVEPLKTGGAVASPTRSASGDSIYTLHSEVRTLPESFGASECDFRLSLAPQVLERARELIARPRRGDRRAAAAARRRRRSTYSAARGARRARRRARVVA